MLFRSESVPPWEPGSDTAQAQQVFRAPKGISDATYADIHGATAPTIWVMTDHLNPRDPGLLVRAGCTDLAVEIDLTDADQVRPLLKQVRRVVKVAQLQSSQQQLRVHLYWPSPTPSSEGIQLAHALGAWSLTTGRLPSTPPHTPGMTLRLAR